MTDSELREAAARTGTPAYIFDLDEARTRAGAVRAMLGGGIGLCFAMKSNPFLTGALASCVDRIECCSIGEFRIAAAQSVPPEKILFSGVLKTEEDIAEVMDRCGARCLYTAESPAQFCMLEEAAARRGIRVRVLLRLTGGNQFGMAFGDLMPLYEAAETSDAVSIAGIHFFTGTQKHFAPIRKELKTLGERMDEIRSRGWPVPELEYGPGFPVRYFEQEREPLREDDVRETVRLAGALGAGRVTFEMGRFLAASCGVYLTKILDLKRGEEPDAPAICITDGGIHQIQYDGQFRGMFTPEIRVLRERPDAAEAKTGLYTLCGSLCTANDVLCGKYAASGLRPGDLLAFDRTGAYSAFEGMALFLSHDLPAVALRSAEEGLRVVRDRQPTWILNTDTQKG